MLDNTVPLHMYMHRKSHPRESSPVSPPSDWEWSMLTMRTQQKLHVPTDNSVHQRFSYQCYVFSERNSHVGSLARLRKRQTFSIEPFSSKSCLKNRAVSMLTWGSGREQGSHDWLQCTVLYVTPYYTVCNCLSHHSHSAESLVTNAYLCSSLFGKLMVIKSHTRQWMKDIFLLVQN